MNDTDNLTESERRTAIIKAKQKLEERQLEERINNGKTK